MQNIKGLRDPPNWLTTGNGFYPITSKTEEVALPATTNGNGASAAPTLGKPTPMKTPSPTMNASSAPKNIPPFPQQTSKPPVIVTFEGNTITLVTRTALEATISGSTIVVTTNSKSELVGTIGGTTVTFTANSASALVGTVGGTIVTAYSEPVLVGNIDGSTVMFTANSESALVGTVGGSTVTAKTASTTAPGTQTDVPGLGGTYTGSGSKIPSSHGVMLFVALALLDFALLQDLI